MKRPLYVREKGAISIMPRAKDLISAERISGYSLTTTNNSVHNSVPKKERRKRRRVG